LGKFLFSSRLLQAFILKFARCRERDLVTACQLAGHASPITTAGMTDVGEVAKRKAVELLSHLMNKRLGLRHLVLAFILVESHFRSFSGKVYLRVKEFAL